MQTHWRVRTHREHFRRAAVLVLALLPAADTAWSSAPPALTPAPNGPYHTEGNLIFDRQNRPYLIRGTKLSPLVLDESAKKGSLVEFRPLSAKTLITIRQRLNMNAVRIPVSVAQYEAGSAYKLRLEEFVRLANRLEL